MRSRCWRRAVGAGLACLLGVCAAGCRGRQVAHVLEHDQPDMVGSHTAGAETYKPLMDEAMARLLARHAPGPAGAAGPLAAAEQIPLPPQRVCFVAVENKSAEELGDFKQQIYQQIDTHLSQSPAFQPISKRFVDAALRETRMRPDQLFVPGNSRLFAAALEQQGQPFDYLLYATLTSGTTESNGHDYQRDYLLTLELVDIRSGQYDKESATLRKGYHRSMLGKLRHYNPLQR